MGMIGVKRHCEPLFQDLAEFCRKHFGPNEWKALSTDTTRDVTIEAEPPSLGKEYKISIEINYGKSFDDLKNEIYSNDAAKDFSELLKKWGHLNDTAEIVAGSIHVPLEDIVRIKVELNVLSSGSIEA